MYTLEVEWGKNIKIPLEATFQTFNSLWAISYWAKQTFFIANLIIGQYNAIIILLIMTFGDGSFLSDCMWQLSDKKLFGLSVKNNVSHSRFCVRFNPPMSTLLSSTYTHRPVAHIVFSARKCNRLYYHILHIIDEYNFRCFVAAKRLFHEYLVTYIG